MRFIFSWNQSVQSPAQKNLAWHALFALRVFAQNCRTCLIRHILQLTGKCVAHYTIRFDFIEAPITRVSHILLCQMKEWKMRNGKEKLNN